MFKIIVMLLFFVSWPLGYIAAGLHAGFMAGYRAFVGKLLTAGEK